MTRAGRIRVALVGGAAAALEFACRAGWVDPISVIPPTKMVAGAYRLLASGEYYADMLFTLENVGLSLLISIAFGFLGGLVLHRLPRLRKAIDPMLASYYAVPTFLFYPLFIVLFGLNRWPLVAIGVLFGVVAMMINTLLGFDRVPVVLSKAARVMRLTRTQEIALVTLPACAPYIFTGVKLAIVYSFIGVIAGEFVLSGAGFGFKIAFAYNNFDNATMYGLLLLMLLLVGGVNMLLYYWEQRLYARQVRA